MRRFFGAEKEREWPLEAATFALARHVHDGASSIAQQLDDARLRPWHALDSSLGDFVVLLWRHAAGSIHLAACLHCLASPETYQGHAYRSTGILLRRKHTVCQCLDRTGGSIRFRWSSRCRAQPESTVYSVRMQEEDFATRSRARASYVAIDHDRCMSRMCLHVVARSESTSSSAGEAAADLQCRAVLDDLALYKGD